MLPTDFHTGFLTNSEGIIRNSSMLHKGIIEMQSGFRGFLLTGNENFLQLYYEGLKEMPSLLIKQKSLIKASILQSAKIDSINLHHKEWILMPFP